MICNNIGVDMLTLSQHRAFERYLQQGSGLLGFVCPLAYPRAAKGKRRRRAAIAARHLRLKGLPAMRDAIREARIDGITAEVEVRLARMTQRPFANAFVQIEERDPFQFDRSIERVAGIIGVVIVTVWVLCALFPDLLAPYDPLDYRTDLNALIARMRDRWAQRQPLKLAA